MKARAPTLILALLAILPVSVSLSAKRAPPRIIPETQRLCKQLLPSGLGWRVLKPGSGMMPVADGMVRLGYIGYFAKTGAVFDDNPDTWLSVKGVVPGFAEGLKRMQPGGIYRLCVPWRLGYGADGGGPIPPRSDLVFQVTLIDAKSREAYQAMVKAAKEARK